MQGPAPHRIEPRRVSSLDNVDIHLSPDDEEQQGQGANDPDYVDTLVRDATLQSIRAERRDIIEPQSDIMAARAVSGHWATQRAMAEALTRTTAPVDWTSGYRLPPATGHIFGHIKHEGGWGVDVAAMKIVSSQIDRTVHLNPSIDQRYLAAAKMSFERATTAMDTMVRQAFEAKYDFTPRTAVDVRDIAVHVKKAKGKSLAPSAKALPWVVGLNYELASRYFDRMWQGLSVHRGENEIFTEVSVVRHFSQFLLGELRAEATDTLKRAVEKMIGDIGGEFSRLAKRRNAACRLVMRMRNLDPQYRSALAADGHLLESNYFGSDHHEVEREILHCLWYNSQQLRGLFAAPRGKERYGNPMDPLIFTYPIERVVLSTSDRMTAAITSSSGQIADAASLPYGIRVMVPPAARGYYRRNVVIAFRSGPIEGAEDSEMQLGGVTHAIVVGTVPDQSVITHRTPDNRQIRVADLVASFVVTYAEKSAVPGNHGHVFRPDPNNRDYMEWQIICSLADMESYSLFSHQMDVTPGRLTRNNEVFKQEMQQTFLRPIPETGHTGAIIYPVPRVEVFVEYVPTDETVHAMRKARAKWVHQYPKAPLRVQQPQAAHAGPGLARGTPAAQDILFDPPRSFTGMGTQTLTRYKSISYWQEYFRRTPIVKTYDTPERIETITVKTWAESALMRQEHAMEGHGFGSTTTMMTMGDPALKSTSEPASEPKQEPTETADATGELEDDESNDLDDDLFPFDHEIISPSKVAKDLASSELQNN